MDGTYKKYRGRNKAFLEKYEDLNKSLAYPQFLGFFIGHLFEPIEPMTSVAVFRNKALLLNAYLTPHILGKNQVDFCTPFTH